MSAVQIQSGSDESEFKVLKSPGLQVESLEERSLFSGSVSMVLQPTALQPAHYSSQVYEMPLSAKTAPVLGVAAAPVRVAARLTTGHVEIRPSDDDGVITGVYLDAQPLQRLSHPVEAAISFRGTDALQRHDPQSFAGRPPTARKSANPSTTKRRVLLIEDDPTSRMALATLLTRRGFVVTSASTVADGLSQLSDHPDNVIVDLMLPDGEGERVLQEIRKSHLHSRVTVMTGVSDPARLERLTKLHPESVLSKPVNIAALLRAISITN